METVFLRKTTFKIKKSKCLALDEGAKSAQKHSRCKESCCVHYIYKKIRNQSWTLAVFFNFCHLIKLAGSSHKGLPCLHVAGEGVDVQMEGGEVLPQPPQLLGLSHRGQPVTDLKGGRQRSVSLK